MFHGDESCDKDWRLTWCALTSIFCTIQENTMRLNKYDYEQSVWDADVLPSRHAADRDTWSSHMQFGKWKLPINVVPLPPDQNTLILALSYWLEDKAARELISFKSVQLYRRTEKAPQTLCCWLMIGRCERFLHWSFHPKKKLFLFCKGIKKAGVYSIHCHIGTKIGAREPFFSPSWNCTAEQRKLRQPYVVHWE